MSVYEQPVYILKADILNDTEVVIAKKTKVKLYIKTSGDWIKVYCYPADQSIMKARKTLLIYLFEDDFNNKIYVRDDFEKKLYEKVDLVK